MNRVESYMWVCMEREIPTEELIKVVEMIRDLPPEEQDSIREQKAKEFSEKYPLKKNRVPLRQ